MALTTGFWLLAILSIIAITCIVLLAKDILLAQGAEGQNFAYAMDYINVLMFGGFFTACATALPMLVRNDESPNVATFLLVIGALINIVLDYVFIGVMGLGLSGAALATLLAQACVTVLGIGYFFTQRSSIQITSKEVLFSWNKAKQSLSLGSSALVMYLYGSFVVAMHNALMMHYARQRQWEPMPLLVTYLCFTTFLHKVLQKGLNHQSVIILVREKIKKSVSNLQDCIEVGSHYRHWLGNYFKYFTRANDSIIY